MTPKQRFITWRLGLLIPVLTALSPALAAELRTNAPTHQMQYSDYSVIADRNIFNTRRTPRRSGGAQPERREVVRRSSGAEFLSLVGTMNYEKGPVAFFEGSRTDYRKAVRPGDKLGAYRVASIDHKGVRLLSGTNWFVVPVGKQLRSEAEGVWEVTDNSGRDSRSSAFGDSSRRVVSFSPPSSVAGSSQPQGHEEGGPTVLVLDPVTGIAVAEPGAGVGGTNTTAVTDGGGENEVLRRLMQRREQEVNR